VAVLPESLVADAGAAASARVAASVGPSPPSVAVGPGAGPAVVLPDVAVVAGGVVPPADAVVVAGVLARGRPLVAPEDPALLAAGRLDDVPEPRCVVVLVVGREVGFGATAAGGRVLGGLPAPNAQPSTLPAFGRKEPAPTEL
jgi:hypothetical protein